MHTDYLPEQFTWWGAPRERLSSEYGVVSYKEWCTREADRIAGRHACYVRRNGTIRCAIFLGVAPAALGAKLLHVGKRGAK